MLYYQELTLPEWDRLDRERTAIFIPFSPLEEHGPHLPIGTDLIVATRLAEDLARGLEERRPGTAAVLIPAVPLGAGTMPLRGSVNITVDVVYDVARQMGSAFARDGFHTIVFVNGHLGAWHLIALENAARWIARRYGICAVAPAAALAHAMIAEGTLAATIGDRLNAGEIRELLSAAHGGMLETSLMLALRPDLVRPAYANLPRLGRRAMAQWRGRGSVIWPGYVGAPMGASAEWGEAARDHLVTAGVTLIAGLMDGTSTIAEARYFPALPLWLSWRRLGMGLATGALGACLALAGMTLTQRGKKGKCFGSFARYGMGDIRPVGGFDI